MVVTLPPLRSIICTGTDILYPKAKLFIMFTVKNMAALGSQRMIGTAGGLRSQGNLAVEMCAGSVKRKVTRNCVKVMRRPSIVSGILRSRFVLSTTLGFFPNAYPLAQVVKRERASGLT